MAAAASDNDATVGEMAKPTADNDASMVDATVDKLPLPLPTSLAEPEKAKSKEPDQPPLQLTRKNLARLDALYGKPNSGTIDSAYLL